MSIIYEPKGRALEYSFLAANLYTGCSHGCTYCYARSMTKDFDNPRVRKDVLIELEKDAVKYAGTNKRVLLCFMCDPYQIGISGNITRQAIDILKAYKIPFQVLTKCGITAARDFDLYEKGDAFATTLTFLNLGKSLEFEPRAASPVNRIEAIKLAHEKGIETWISLEPVIDIGQSLDIIDYTHEFCDLYKIGKINHVKYDLNWNYFGRKAIERCEKFGKKYYIKDDLAKYLKGVPFENTDTRIFHHEEHEEARRNEKTKSKTDNAGN